MARKNKNSEHDDGTYKSRSSIDSPPREESEPSDTEQEVLPGFEQELERISEEPYERKFKAELVLTLTPVGNRAVKIPVVFGEFPSTRIKEILTLGLNCRRVTRIVEAVLDNPVPTPLSVSSSEFEIKTDDNGYPVGGKLLGIPKTAEQITADIAKANPALVALTEATQAVVDEAKPKKKTGKSKWPASVSRAPKLETTDVF